MLHFPLRSPQLTHFLLQLKLTKPPISLSGSSTSANRFSISYRSPMTITRNTMINIGCHIIFRWATKFGCTCRKNALQDPIKSFSHSIMGHTPSPRPWGIMLLSSTFLLSLACTQCSTWISFALISHLLSTQHSLKILCQILLFGYHLIFLHCLIKLQYGKCCLCLSF
jgi:hypothetical protein